MIDRYIDPDPIPNKCSSETCDELGYCDCRDYFYEFEDLQVLDGHFRF